MKKLLASALSFALLVSLFTIPAAAKEKYDYQPFTFYDTYGGTLTFEAAALGWGLSFYWTGQTKPQTTPLIILKDNSTVKIDGSGSTLSLGHSDNHIAPNGIANLQGWDMDLPSGEINYWSNATFKNGFVEDMFAEQMAPLACAYTPSDQPVFFVLESNLPKIKTVYPGPAIDNTPAKSEETTKTNPDIYIFDQGLKEPLGYTVTNNTGKQFTAHCALLSYWPKTIYYPATEIAPQESEFFYGQLLSLDLNLAPGESTKGDCWAAATGWSTMKHCWIQFDDKTERDAFFQNNALRLTPGAHLTGNNTFEIDHGDTGIQWMKDVLGIAIESGKK